MISDSSKPASDSRTILFHTRPPLWLLMLFAMSSPFSLLLFIPALPSIAVDMESGLAIAQWVITAYLLSVGLMQIVIGPLVDSLGRRYILLFSLVCYVSVSLFAVTSIGIEVIILCRIVQGLCVAALSVVSRAVIHDVFFGLEAGKAMSFITLSMQIPGFIAPAIGGLLAHFFGWEALFVFQAAYGIALLSLAFLLQPETRPNNSREKTSVTHIMGDYLSLIANAQFSVFAAIIGFCAAAAMTFMTIFPSALTELFDKSADVVGYFASLNSVASITGALMAANLVFRLGIVPLLTIGLAGIVVYLGAYIGSLWLFPATLMTLFVALLVTSFCQSIVISMGFAQALKAEDRLRGTASGLAGAVTSIVSACFAAVGATLYASGLTKALLVVFGCFLAALVVLSLWKLQAASLVHQSSGCLKE